MPNDLFYKFLICLMLGVVFANLLNAIITPKNRENEIMFLCEKNGFYYFDHGKGIKCSPIIHK